jgi:hypothetical protein
VDKLKEAERFASNLDNGLELKEKSKLIRGFLSDKADTLKIELKLTCKK